MSAKPLPVDKATFAIEIRKSLAAGELTRGAIKDLYTLLEIHASRKTYKNRELREDVIGWAMIIICKKWQKYNPEITDNAFSYYYKMTSNALMAGWNKYMRKQKGTIQISLDSLNNNDSTD